VVCCALLPARGQVVINEIMYNPGPSHPDSEYVELLNPTPSTVDLSGYQFEEGIEFRFPQGMKLPGGAYLVVCRNKAAFAVAYPGVSNVLGPYGGGLDNSGEKLELSRLYYGKRVPVDTVEYNDRGEWTKAADGKGPSVELVHPGFDNQYPEAWAPSTDRGTPGRENSTFQRDPAPIITDVLHKPGLPGPLSRVSVIARVLGHRPERIAVILRHRRDKLKPDEYKTLPMTDDGRHGDGRAGDGIFGAAVPGLPENAVLDFQIMAKSAAGAVSKAPPGHPQETFLCFFGRTPPGRREYPEYHVLLTKANRRELETREVSSRDQLDATLVCSDGRVFYNCGVRYRGSSARVHYAGPKSFRVNLRQGRTLDGTDRLNFNAVNPLLQHLGMDLFRRNGVQAPETQLCRVWLNETLLSQAGEKWVGGSSPGIYVRMERIDDDFVAKHYPDADEGNLYEGTGSRDKTSGELDWRGPDVAEYKDRGYAKETNEAADDWTDIVALCKVLTATGSPNYASNLRARVNLEQWISYFAVHMILNNNETCIATVNGTDYHMYCNPTNGQFDLLPWDMDSVLDLSGKGAPTKRGQPFADTTQKSIWQTKVPAVRGFLRHRQIAPLFVARILEILNTTFSPQAMAKQFDAIGSALTPNYRRELEKSVEARIAFVRKEIKRAFSAKVEGKPLQPGRPVTVGKRKVTFTGTAPQPNIMRVLINDKPAGWNPYKGTWTKQLELKQGMNSVVIQAVDVHGKVQKSMTVTVVAR